MTSNGESHHQTNEVEPDPQDVLAYWTEERQRRALPVEGPRLGPDRGPLPQVAIDHSAPVFETESLVGPHDPSDPSSDLEGEVIATAPVFNPAVYPHRTVGKLFYRAAGQDFAASAAVVDASGILTAAHCVRPWASGQWATNVAFAPAFDNGVNPLFGGLWAVGRMFVRNEWIGPPGDLSFDFAFCQVPSRGFTRIGDLTGQLGIMGGRPEVRYWDDHGYPGAPIPGFPFDGRVMWNCGGRLTRTVGLTVRKEGNLTPGASGGPWIVQGADGNFYANGTYSMWFDGSPTENTSPYFRDVVASLFHDAFG